MKQAFGLDIPTTLQDVCNAQRMALLVYDMQVGIAGRLPNATRVIEKAKQTLEIARSAGIRLFFCRHLTLPNEVAGVAQLKSSMKLQRLTNPAELKPNFLRDSPGFSIIPDLEPLPCEAVFDKLAMSAFVGSLFDYALRDARIEAFAVVGAVLELGIEPTVRQGADLGYLPVVIADACYSLSGAVHKQTLEALTNVSIVTDVAGFKDALE
jgi:biuret amidohydrolase